MKQENHGTTKHTKYTNKKNKKLMALLKIIFTGINLFLSFSIFVCLVYFVVKLYLNLIQLIAIFVGIGSLVMKY